MATTFTERTPLGQQVSITTEDFFPVRLDLQGVQFVTTMSANFVAMGIQDAREIHAALGKALAAYDLEDGVPPPAEPYDQGTINEAFVGDCAFCGCNDLAGNNGDAAECGCKCHAPMPDWD